MRRDRPIPGPRPAATCVRPVAVVAALVLTLSMTLVGCAADEPAAGSAAGAAADPEYKVTVAGDSISVGLGASLRGVVDDDVVVKVIGVEGTGLARTDTFDWPGRLRELARDFPPEVLVLSLASNDAQDLVDAQGNLVAPFSDTDAWDTEYAARLAASFDAFADTGTTVVWVGHVRTQEDRVGAVNRRVHELATEVAASRDWVEVRDLASYLGSGEGIATSCLMPDGLHLVTTCLDQAATKLEADLPARTGAA